MRYLMTFSYDGSNFYGYQKQPNKRSVQEEIEKVLSKINNKKISISASGRTDARVHAQKQKAHFDMEKNIDLDRLKHSLNKLLPDDIYIKRIEEVNDDFHARFNVKKKTYIYKINTAEYNPFDRNYVYQYNKKLNIKNMIEAANVLIGEHNFKSFTKANSEIEDYTRTIYDINIEENNNIITLTFVGSGFLRYMVRNIVGTLIAVGENKITRNNVKEILKKEDRREALLTAPPEGLYLYNVEY